MVRVPCTTTAGAWACSSVSQVCLFASAYDVPCGVKGPGPPYCGKYGEAGLYPPGVDADPREVCGE